MKTNTNLQKKYENFRGLKSFKKNYADIRRKF